MVLQSSGHKAYTPHGPAHGQRNTPTGQRGAGTQPQPGLTSHKRSPRHQPCAGPRPALRCPSSCAPHQAPGSRPGQFGTHGAVSQRVRSPTEPAARGKGQGRSVTAAEAGREAARPALLHADSGTKATRPQVGQAVTNSHPKRGHPHVPPRENSTKPGRSCLSQHCQTQIQAWSARAETWEKAGPVRSSPQDALLPSSKQHKEIRQPQGGHTPADKAKGTRDNQYKGPECNWGCSMTLRARCPPQDTRPSQGG